MYKPSNMLDRSLNETPLDYFKISSAIVGEINADPQFKTTGFDQAIAYALANGCSEGELFKSFDSEFMFKEDRSEWDEEYYTYVIMFLKKNFSNKRIEHVKHVAAYIYKPNTNKVNETTQIIKGVNEKKPQDHKIETKKSLKVVIVLLVALVIITVLLVKIIS